MIGAVVARQISHLLRAGKDGNGGGVISKVGSSFVCVRRLYVRGKCGYRG
jgi:hypothetical protein